MGLSNLTAINHLTDLLEEMGYGRFNTYRDGSDGPYPVVAVSYDALRDCINSRIRILTRSEELRAKRKEGEC